MRSRKVWRKFIDEMKEFIRMTNADGLMLDCADFLPIYFRPNWEELNRNNCDGTPSYTEEDKLISKIVTSHASTPYDFHELGKKPNAFWFYVANEMKSEFPNLLLIGDLHEASTLGHKENMMIRSGLVPRGHNYPLAFSVLFGKKMGKDGSINDCQPYHVSSVKRYYQEFYDTLPSGSLMIQSFSNYSTPYPA